MNQTSPTRYTIVPSLPAQSFDELFSLSTALADSAPELQVDIVDGAFVPAVSWPFTEENPIASLRRITELPHYPSLELDCMVREPEQYLELFAELAVWRVIFHVGSTDDLTAVLQRARVLGCTVGIAFTNDVPLETVYAHIDAVNFVQIMGIAEVGSQGQPFDIRTLKTAASLRERYPTLDIAVDGSVNRETIPSLKAAGVTRFAPGSAIARADNPRAAYEELVTLVASSTQL